MELVGTRNWHVLKVQLRFLQMKSTQRFLAQNQMLLLALHHKIKYVKAAIVQVFSRNIITREKQEQLRLEFD